MPLIVQKFGGTSVGDPERIRKVADRVVHASEAGVDLVVVVSAMGHTTDELMGLASAVAAEPRRHPRELDMLLTAGERISMALLAMALCERGVEAVSLTGSQAAIITDGSHTGARIEEIRVERVRQELGRGRIVIVAGFQGVSRAREVTTLGRGGSDTTAVALGAALGADRVDIYTDVRGVFTADPRKVPGARHVPVIAFEEMLELAASGAQVMHPRAVEIGARFGIPIRVLSSFEDREDGGTLITHGEDPAIERLALTGLASETGFVRFVLRGLPGGMAPTTEVLSRFAKAGISVDVVAHADRADGRRQLQLTVREAAFPEARELFEALVRDLGAEAMETRHGIAQVVLVGSGMHDRPGVYADAFGALLDADIEVLGLTTSAISISLLIDEEREPDALRALHATFGLEGGPDAPPAPEAEPRP
ncbi:MAG TPA: aspartate kinase [Longimicrobiales bacterium]|nr:aspartate kinase [Longimicrobiales bacterium]